MSATKQTQRGKGRKRTAPREKTSAPVHERKRAAQHRKASASDVPDNRTWSGQVESPPTAPEPKTVLQEKLDTLIGLLAETEPAAPHASTPHATPAVDSPSLSPTPHALHKEMLWRIASLEVTMAALPSRRQGPDGDDSTSERIRPEPFSESDRQAIANSIAVLKAQPPEPSEPPVEALEAAQLLRAIGTATSNAASPGGADTVLSAAVKSTGSPLWLANRIGAAADAAIHWINSLEPPF
jgi:hypothetical protein